MPQSFDALYAPKAMSLDELFAAIRPPPLLPLKYEPFGNSGSMSASFESGPNMPQPNPLDRLWAGVQPHLLSLQRMAAGGSVPMLPRENADLPYLPVAAAAGNEPPSWYAGKRGFPPRPNPEFKPTFQHPMPGVRVCEPGMPCGDTKWQWNPNAPIFRIDPATGKMEFYTPDGPQRLEDTDQHNRGIPDSGQPPSRKYFVPGLIS